MISVAVDSTLSQLAGSYKVSDGEEKNNYAKEPSTNYDKKVRLKSILKKSKRE